MSRTYSVGGTYTITISGKNPNEVTGFNGFGNPSYLSSVSSWGGFNLTSLFAAFANINGLLTSFPSLPSTVTDIGYIFAGSRNLTIDLSSWDVSGVRLMNNAFEGINFNPNIGSWNVSNVTNMDYIFLSSSFNSDISNWNVGKVTDMYGMFAACSSFNQDLSKWNVGNVINIKGIFIKT